MAERATYVYCVVHHERRPAVARVPSGLPGATRPMVVEVRGPLWIVVSEVPMDVYGPERLEPALRNLDWVAEIAVAHEAVVEHFRRIRGATVVPMKLFTMFSTQARAVADTRARARELSAIVKRIVGCDEWGIRVNRTPMSAPVLKKAARAASGTAFLAAKKQARDEARQAILLAPETAEEVYGSLAVKARAARRREPPENATTPPLLDAAFLVPSTARTDFLAAVRLAAGKCRTAGAELTLTGPWAAYNFIQSAEGRD
jgi:hypothetical protein